MDSNQLLKNSRVVFIGAGNMAEALVQGLVRKNVCDPKQLQVTDVRPERLEYFRKTSGVDGSADNAVAVQDADVVVLAVKPQVMAEVLRGFRGSLKKDVMILSIAAGIPTVRLEEMLGGPFRIVRSMPNTPALVGAGASAICAGKHAVDNDLVLASQLLGAVGIVVRVEETEMDAVTALSGSGPAYFFYVVEAMLDAARELGFDAKTAKQLVAATVEGAGKLLRETGTDAGELRRRVTSKGGTTAAAIGVLDEHQVHQWIAEAVKAAHRRSRELSGS